MPAPRLMDQVRAAIRLRHYSRRTEDAYVRWIKRFILCNEKRHLEDVVRANRPKRLPVVLSRGEVTQLLSMPDGSAALIAQLIHGTGLRLMEALRLGVEEVEFEYRQILARAGKGDKDRVTVLPDALIERLQAHLEDVKTTMIYTHVTRRGGRGVRSPLDRD
jgi:integrase